MTKNKETFQIKVRSGLRAGEGGGYVNGVYYPDMSGTCGSSTTPPSQPSTHPKQWRAVM